MIDAYYNGTFCNSSDIKIPFGDRSVFFGDGIYDAAVGKNGKIYLSDEHINRFMKNAKLLDIPLYFGFDGISEILHRLIEKSGLSEYFIYFQASRAANGRAHSYSSDSRSNLLVTVKEHKMPKRNERLSLMTVNDLRYSFCNVKTLNLLPNVLASTEASKRGCDEAVFVRDGIVTECSHSNIFIIKNGILKTHPDGPFILPGITKARILKKCRELNIPFLEEPFSKEELYSSDAILVSSTTKLCLLASEIDRIRMEISENSSSISLINALFDDFSRLMEK